MLCMGAANPIAWVLLPGVGTSCTFGMLLIKGARKRSSQSLQARLFCMGLVTFQIA